MRWTVVVGGLAVVAALAVGARDARACEGANSNFGPCPKTAAAPAKPSLYKRLGGREGIAQVVNAFVANVVADPRLAERFKGIEPAAVERVKSNVADQICEATGGPCSYIGRDMKTVHTGMKISDADWDATVENLVKALDGAKVGPAEKTELLNTLGPMKAQIVGQ